MRKFVYFCSALGAPLIGLFLFSSTVDLDGFISPSRTKSYTIAILPICNPGTRCDPELPKNLKHGFFKHPSSVARYLKKLSNSQILIKGTAINWLRAKQRLRNSTDVINNLPELLSMASTEIKLSDFDIFFFYLNTPGHTQSIAWPPGQIISVNHTELSPGIGIMINTPLYEAVDLNIRTSTVLPATTWAQSLVRILGFNDQQSHSCHE
jgi:hypothetical protein